MHRFFIVYPESRYIDAQTIATWYGDADANGELDPCDVYDHAQLRRAPTPAEMARALSNAGLITLAKPR